VQHPFELSIADLESIETVEIEDINPEESNRVMGGSATIAGAVEAGGGFFPCYSRRSCGYPRRKRKAAPLQSTPTTATSPSSGRFASQEAYEAYLNSPDFDPELLTRI
jgi:hypothetical protein